MYFFFSSRRRHTRSLRDWSSDVCSSDLHEVATADDGKRGLELALHTKPEIAIVDIGLPGIDGYEVAKRIRSAGHEHMFQIGRASCRERVYVSVGAGSLKKKSITDTDDRR